jgi:CBS-domain-containing membrane protein
MTRSPLKTVTPDSDLKRALELLVEGTLNQVPVVDGDHLVGLLSRADVLRFLQLSEELDLARLPRTVLRRARAKHPG